MSATDYQAQAAASTTRVASSPSNKRLRVAVIGLGIGRMHIEGWRQHPHVDVVAIADTDAHRLDQVGEQFGIARRRGMPGFGGWFGTKALAGGGPLIDLGVHRLDLALWLMGYPKPQWVMGNTYCLIA